MKDLQHLVFAPGSFGGYGGFHLGMVAGNVIRMGLEVQGWVEGTSILNTALFCWLEEGLCNPVLGHPSGA